MNQKLGFWSIVFALGGLLLVNSISETEHEIQKVRNSIDVLHVQAIISPFYVTIIAALFSDISAVKFGQKKFLIWIGILFLMSAISAGVAAGDVLIAFRFLGNMCVGASSILALIFITKISPPKTRGKLIVPFQFTLVCAILLVYFSNYFLSTVGEDALELKLDILAIPALVFGALMFFVTGSPHWLRVSRQDDRNYSRILEVVSSDYMYETTKAFYRSIDKEKQRQRHLDLFERLFTTYSGFFLLPRQI